MNRSQAERLKRKSYSYKHRRLELLNDLKDKFIVFLIAIGILLAVYFFIIWEFGSLENWWNQ